MLGNVFVAPALIIPPDAFDSRHAADFYSGVCISSADIVFYYNVVGVVKYKNAGRLSSERTSFSMKIFIVYGKY
jgi:hypothetical protein